MRSQGKAGSAGGRRPAAAAASRGGAGGRAPRTTAPPPAQPEASARKTPLPPSRVGKKAITFVVDPAVYIEARMLTVRESSSIQALMTEALVDVLAKRGIEVETA